MTCLWAAAGWLAVSVLVVTVLACAGWNRSANITRDEEDAEDRAAWGEAPASLRDSQAPTDHLFMQE
jgi:hypothetical protein